MKGKVIEPEEETEEDSEEEEEEEEEEEVEEEPVKRKKPRAGDILNYTKEVPYDTYVIDEEGNRILCEDMKEAKALSLLLEIKQILVKKK